MRYAISIILTILLSSSLHAQSYTYSYVDPCTKMMKTVTIPSGQSNIQVTYYGTVNNFSQADFQNGNFLAWMNSVSAINSNKPCDQVATALTTTTNLIVTQNIISTLTNITSVSMMAADLSNNIASVASGGVNNAIGNATNNSSETGDNNSNNGGGSEGSSGGSGSSGSGGSNEPSSPGGGGSGGSGGTGGSGGSGGSGGGSGTPSESGSTPPQESGTENKSGGNGGTANSVSNAAESSGGGGDGKSSSKTSAKVGSMIGTGDLVVIRSAEDKNAKDQFKFTMSMTHANSKNTFAKGFLGNFTTQINNSNITLYGAWTKKNKTLIAANSTMLNFDRDVFNTTTTLGSVRYKKASVMLGLNATVGKLGKTEFVNLSAVGGGFFMFKPAKKVTGTLLLLGVYSPFTQFYEGSWWESGLLLVPFSSWDYSITKKFKFNLSVSGVYQSSGSVLNYQVLTGGKVLF